MGNIPQYAMGYDFGNEDAIGVVYKRGIPYIQSIPTVSVEGSWLEYLRKQGGSRKEVSSHQRQQVANGEFVLEYRNAETFLGNLAFHSRNVVVTRNDVTRYWGIRTVEFLLTLSGTLIPDPEYKVHLVTGLPVDGTTDKNKNAVMTALENGGKAHTFKLNGRERYCEVEVHKVMMEGAGALLIEGSEVPRTKGVIDIGGRTTNLFVVNANDTVDYDRTRMDTNGVARIGDLANERFKQEEGYDLVPGMMRQCLRAYIGKGEWPRDIRKEDIYDFIHGSFLRVSNDINSFIGKIWYTSEQGYTAADIPEIHLVGGGSYYFREEIKKIIPKVLLHSQPEYANVMGYAGLAQDYLEEELDQHQSMAI